MPSLPSYSKYSQIAESICCPNCKDAVTFNNALWCGTVVINAGIMCRNCGECGSVCNTKFIFNDNPRYRLGRSGSISGSIVSARRADYREGLELSRGWNFEETRCWSKKAGSQILFETDALGVDLRFLKHSWAGIAEILVNGESLCEVDLFEEAGSMELAIPISLDRGANRIAVRVTGQQSEGSKSCQVFFCGFDELVFNEGQTNDFQQFSGNLGNPYPERWVDLVNSFAADELILDCGAGDRRYPDQRVVNFEYTPFALPDVFGDGHHLPFKDETFGLVLSQAVIEHLYDPFAAVKEIHRVSKRGAVTFAESAFMQPLHAVPFHFFNTTKWGMEKLFEDFLLIKTESVGTLTQTLTWIYSLVDIPEAQREVTQDIIKLVSEVDAHISEKDLEKFASFIRLEAKRA